MSETGLTCAPTRSPDLRPLPNLNPNFQRPPHTLPFFYLSFVVAVTIRVMTGLDDYLYAYDVSKLPVSTTSLLVATQLGFTVVFAFLIVKQRFTAYSVNTVVLLMVGSVVLGLHTGGDRPEGETDREYWVGFFMTLSVTALYGLIQGGVKEGQSSSATWETAA